MTKKQKRFVEEYLVDLNATQAAIRAGYKAGSAQRASEIGSEGEIPMRYDTPIYFQKLTPGEYDPTTGNYGEDAISEDMKSASVMDTGTNTMMLVYSGIKEGSLTIHLQNHYDRPFDRIRVGNKTYGVDFSRKLRTKQVYVVSEVV